MQWLNILISRLRALVRREAVLEDIDEELRLHVEMETEALIERGMRPEQARASALRSFGNLARIRDLAYEVRGGGMLETLWQDLRYGARMLASKRSFTLIAVITLALGIGANTAIFSVVYAVLLRPLPYPEPERLTLLWTKLEKIGLEQNWVSEPEVLDFREQSQLFESFGVVQGSGFILTGNGEPEQLRGAQVSTNFFSMLGAKIRAGRDFAPDEEIPGAPQVAILSHGFWQRRFGGEQSVINSTINLSGNPTTVIGVLPANFALMVPPEALVPASVDVWIPYAVDYAKQERDSHGLTVIGRLKPGVTLAQAREEMSGIASRLYPLHYTHTGFEVKVVSLHADLVKKMRPALLVLLAAVGFVLLIACANVANLLLGLAVAREKEMAIRAAMGAGRARLLRQLMTESVLLSMLGGALGLGLAVWGVEALLALSPADLPRIDEVSIDLRVLGFTFAVASLTGFFFGLIPAMKASRINLTQSLKEGSRSVAGGASQRLRSLIVIAEIALSLVLLVGAGLLVRSFFRLTRVDPGFNAHNVLTMKIAVPRSKYKDGEATASFYRHLLEKIQSLPGVESAAAISHLPLSGDYWGGTLTFEGVTANAERADLASFEVDQRVITPDYFTTMKTSLLEGRFFNTQDVKGRPFVAIIDETLARRLWPNASPLGRRFTFGRFPDKPETWIEIVGVVRHIRHHRLESEVREQVYYPHAIASFSGMTLAIRTASDPLNMVSAVNDAVRSLDPDQPVYSVRTMDELVAGALASPRFTLLLLLIFAGVAGMLAVVGIYGVMSRAVTQRTHEIGVRMALGAQVSDVVKLIVSHGVRLVAIGTAAGLAGAFLLTRLMASLLFNVSATDSATFIIIPLILAGVALGACAVPARRAAKVDPVVALRYE
jgi:putative ABC transport system permease protein